MLNEMNNPESDHPQFNLLFCPELYLTKNYKDLFVTFYNPADRQTNRQTNGSITSMAEK